MSSDFAERAEYDLRSSEETHAAKLDISDVQYMHIPSRDMCNWLRERIETKDPIQYSSERKVHILDRLAWSEMYVSASCCLCSFRVDLHLLHACCHHCRTCHQAMVYTRPHAHQLGSSRVPLKLWCPLVRRHSSFPLVLLQLISAQLGHALCL